MNHKGSVMVPGAWERSCGRVHPPPECQKFMKIEGMTDRLRKKDAVARFKPLPRSGFQLKASPSRERYGVGDSYHTLFERFQAALVAASGRIGLGARADLRQPMGMVFNRFLYRY